MSPGERQRRGNKRAFLNAYKLMLGCEDCARFSGVRLDFDHRVKAEKRFKVGANVCQSWRALLDEIAKCDVRCAPCHSKRHHREEPGARARKHRAA